MNEQIKFEGLETFDLMNQFVAFGIASFLLSIAANQNTEKAALEVIEQADRIGYGFQNLEHDFCSGAYYDLRGAVIKESVTENDKDEFYYQSLFKKYAGVIYPEYEVIHREVTQKHMPDAWVSYNGDDLPVEVKKGEFDNRAMTQLTRYMDFYKCEYGIAVAKSGTARPWPDNIFFVSLDELEKAKEQDQENVKRDIELEIENKERLKKAIDCVIAFFNLPKGG